MVEVRRENNYWVVLLNGEFYCSEDTHKEAVATATELEECGN